MATIPSHALYGLLSGVSAVTDLVGTRIYPTVAPEGAITPYLVYSRFDTAEEEAMGANADILATRFSVLCVADTHDACEALYEEVRNACRRYQGTLNGVEVADMRLEDGGELDYVEAPPTFTAEQLIELRYRRTA